MSSTINRLLAQLFPLQAFESKTIMLGLDDSGKTSILYRLKLKEAVDIQNFGTSMGFAVETVEVKLQEGSFETTLWELGGGRSNSEWVRRMLHHYMEGVDALIWAVNSADPERFPESVQRLQQVIDSHVQRLECQRRMPNMLPILILANKSDSPRSVDVDKIREIFAATTRGRLVAVYSVSALRNIGLKEAFGWLQTAMDISRNPGVVVDAQQSLEMDTSQALYSLPPTKVASPNPRSPTLLAQKLESWLRRAETDSPPDELLKRFEECNLPVWDHYAHIRVAYLILQKYGRKEGKDKIFKGIENYIANNEQAQSRPFNLTLTYFWIQIVHFAIRNTPAAPDGLDDNDVDAFFRFLLVNPHVVDGMLWEDFYSKDILMGAKARSEMVLPDKAPLPSITLRDAITNFGKGK